MGAVVTVEILHHARVDYVRMSTEDEARESIDLLNGAMLGEGLIVVKEAPPKHSQIKQKKKVQRLCLP